MDEEFYIGYHDKAPRKLSRWLAAISTLLIVFAMSVGTMLLASQNPFDASIFEFGSPIRVVGVYSEVPVPNLTSSESGDLSEQYVLVSEGKHGAKKDWAAFEGNVVELLGTRIFRAGMLMLEVVDNSVSATEKRLPVALPTPEFLDSVSLSGEIVDSKCFLGVMNPGAKTVHHACAELCIRGGIPPLLVVRDLDGSEWMAVLTGNSGEAITQEILPYIAQPVRVSGSLFKHGTLLEIRTDPASIQRLH